VLALREQSVSFRMFTEQLEYSLSSVPRSYLRGSAVNELNFNPWSQHSVGIYLLAI